MSTEVVRCGHGLPAVGSEHHLQTVRAGGGKLQWVYFCDKATVRGAS